MNERLDEFYLNQTNSLISGLTKKTREIRNQEKGKEVKIAKITAYDPSTFTLFVLTEPTFDFSVMAYNNDSDKWQTESLYTMQIRFKDLDLEIAEYGVSIGVSNMTLSNIKLQQFRDVLSRVDILVDCDCGSYNWTGHRYRLTQIGSAIFPQDIPDPVWRKRHGSKGGLCKHLAGMLKTIRFNAPVILKYIRGK